MKIKNEVLDEILHKMPLYPPEVGGIIGGKNGFVNIWHYDIGVSTKGCVYIPNVGKLNNIIAEWIDDNYDFMGIFHVHFGGARNLSEEDKLYIDKIMRAMPTHVSNLYFPIIVQPENICMAYKAIRNINGEIKIVEDTIDVVN